MQYPGRVIKAGEKDAAVVRLLKMQLNKSLAIDSDPVLRLVPEEPCFDSRMTQTVKLFQARNADTEGQPLVQDGKVGFLTWASLFNVAVSVNANLSDALLARVLQLAAGEEARQVREVPVNSNRGPDVEAYLRSVNIGPGYPWCCAFVYWCFQHATPADQTNPMVKTADCLDHWNRATANGARRVLKQHAVANPSLIKPGMIFIMDHGEGKGHTGLVESVSGGFITTIEGNTDASKTREGGGVYRLTRKIVEINKGFIDYTRV